MLCAIFAGCGKKDETTVETPEQSDEMSGLWKTQGFAISPDNTEKQGSEGCCEGDQQQGTTVSG
ncbi:MAG: hypothetical protein K2K63_00720 [Acetatifactor sp.]|nr:hypothetical protein [Acetatifactor sp.]